MSLKAAINIYSRALEKCGEEDKDLKVILYGNRCESKI